MKLWMSSEIDADLLAAYEPVEREVKKVINDLLSERQYGGDLDEWAFITMLTRRSTAGYNEIAKLHRKRKVAEFRQRIDADEFRNATARCRHGLLLRAVARTVPMFAKIGVRGMDADGLSSDLMTLGAVRGWFHAREEEES